ncbi:MAG: MBL fold metallo-hydrolase, partial [Actinobacteria bacterium]|nr:MBL fold metallo-hydrolase [Actinomycetota bacterium]
MFDGLARLTLPLPMRPSHVHCYLLESADGWTLVDTGLSLPGSDEVFAQVARELTVSRIVITHFHPD